MTACRTCCVLWIKQQLRPKRVPAAAPGDEASEIAVSATVTIYDRRIWSDSVPVSNTGAAIQTPSEGASDDVNSAHIAVEQLRSRYAAMAADFQSKGLDVQAIAENAAWFETGEPWPHVHNRHDALYPVEGNTLIVVAVHCWSLHSV